MRGAKAKRTFFICSVCHLRESFADASWSAHNASRSPPTTGHDPTQMGENPRLHHPDSDVGILAKSGKLQHRLLPSFETARRGWIVSIGLLMSQMCVSVRADARDVGSLIQQLTADDEQTRVEAAYELGRLDAESQPAEEALIQALTDGSERVRTDAATSLLRIGGELQHVVPLLQDPVPSVRLTAVREILVAGGDVTLVVPTLLDLRVRRPGQDDLSVDVRTVFEALAEEAARSAVPLLLVAGTHTDANVRTAAWLSVRDTCPLDASAVSQIRPLLHDRRADVRASAADAMRRIGAEAHQAIPQLRELLNDPEMRVSVAAAAALGTVDPDHREFALVLARALKHPQRDIRVQSAAWLAELGPPEAVPAMIESLKDPDWSVEGLERAGPAAVPDLVKAIETTGLDRIRQGSATALGRIGPEADAALPALIRAADDADPDTRIAVAKALSAIAPAAETGIPALIKLLTSREAPVRTAAATALGEFDNVSTSVQQTLISALLDGEASVRLAAAGSLVRHGAEAKVVTPTLVKLLTDEDPQICLDTIELFGEMGPAADDAIPALVTAMGLRKGVSAGFGGYSISQSVPWTMAKVGPVAVPSLIDALQHEDSQIRGHAAQALGRIGSPARASVGALLARLSDHGEREGSMGCFGFRRTVREDAIEALGNIGADARSAVAQLVPLLSTDNDEFRRLLIDSLGRIGPDASPALPAVIEAIHGDVHYLRGPALVALARIDPTSASLVPGLKEFLAIVQLDRPSEGGYVSECADVCEVIVQLGPRSKPLIPILTHMVTTHPLLHVWCRCNAASALARLDPDNHAAVAFLQRIAKHSDDTFDREQALEALEQIEKHQRSETGSKK